MATICCDLQKLARLGRSCENMLTLAKIRIGLLKFAKLGHNLLRLAELGTKLHNYAEILVLDPPVMCIAMLNNTMLRQVLKCD